MKFNKTIPSILLILIFSTCAGLPSEEKIPFNITKATYTESVKEINLSINYTSKSDVDFLFIFFKNKTIKIIKNNTNSLTGTYNKARNIDLQLHGDPKKEFGNTSNKNKKPSFKLEDNQAAISYNNDGTIKYFIIKNIIKL